MEENKKKIKVTIEEAISFIGTGKAQYLLLLLTAGGQFANCSELLMFVYSQDPIHENWGINDQTFAWLPFSTSIASLVGGVIFGILSDKFGRRIPFMLSIGISGLFGLVSAFASNFWSFVLLRSLVSVGIGGIFSVDFALLIEFLPVKNRGHFMIMITVGGTLGVAYTAGMAWLLIPSNLFKVYVMLVSVPMILIFLARFFINVESPRFLLSVGKYNEALDVLKWICKQNKREMVLQEYEVAPISKKLPKTNILDLFSAKYAAMTIQISTIWLLQSFGYWGVTIFFPKYVRFYGAPVYFEMFVNVLAELPGFFLAIIMIDRQKFGRLNTLRFFTFGTLISLGLTVFLQDEVAIAVLAVVTYFFMVPIFSILETYTPECYPTLMRSSIMSLVNLAMTIPSTTTAFIGAKVISSHHHWLYPLVWAIVFAIQLIVTLTLRKETLHSSLEEESFFENDLTVYDEQLDQKNGYHE